MPKKSIPRIFPLLSMTISTAKTVEKYLFYGRMRCLFIIYYRPGQNYTSDACLQHPLTNLYLWMMILAVLGCAQRWIDFSNSLTKYLQKRSFALYVFHYPLLVTAAYFITTYTELSMAAVYLILLPFTFAAPILFFEVVSRIPVIRYLLLGI